MASVFTILGQFYDNKANLKQERRAVTEPNIDIQNQVRYKAYQALHGNDDPFKEDHTSYENDIGFLANDKKLYDVSFGETVESSPEWIEAADKVEAAWGEYMREKAVLLDKTVKDLIANGNGFVAKALPFFERAKEVLAKPVNPYIAAGKKLNTVSKPE